MVADFMYLPRFLIFLYAGDPVIAVPADPSSFWAVVWAVPDSAVPPGTSPARHTWMSHRQDLKIRAEGISADPLAAGGDSGLDEAPPSWGQTWDLALPDCTCQLIGMHLCLYGLHRYFLLLDGRVVRRKADGTPTGQWQLFDFMSMSGVGPCYGLGEDVVPSLGCHPMPASFPGGHSVCFCSSVASIVGAPT
eukprot:gene9134-1640_t